MEFGQCQVDFSKCSTAQKIADAFLALPKPNIAAMEAKGTWVSAEMKEIPTYFFVRDNLIMTFFNLTGKQWFSRLQKILESLSIPYTHESLKSGKYTYEVFNISKQYSLYISSLKRGGKGILMADSVHIEYMREQDRESRAKANARKAVLATLTPEQRRALGL